MSKLYYKDPLASAYMAREFGVDFFYAHNDSDVIKPIPPKVSIAGFKDENGKKHPSIAMIYVLLRDNLCRGETDYKVKSIHSEDNKFFIHPDSLHIFEPQVGDLVKMTFTGGDRISHRPVTGKKDGYYEVGGFDDKYGYPNFIGQRKIYEIIQRNNKPFFMPGVSDE